VDDTILSHWKSLLGIWLGINIVLGMPSPKETGPTSQWWYHWLFASLHGIAGALPRLAATLIPGLAKFVPGLTEVKSNGGNNA
jgi:hypothetical protein